MVTQDRHYRIKVLIYWVGRVENSQLSRKPPRSGTDLRESVRNDFWQYWLPDLIESIGRLQCLTLRKELSSTGWTNFVIDSERHRTFPEMTSACVIGHHWSSSPDDNNQRRICLHSGQFLRVKSVACLQWRTCLLASFKESIIARYSASHLLVVYYCFYVWWCTYIPHCNNTFAVGFAMYRVRQKWSARKNSIFLGL